MRDAGRVNPRQQPDNFGAQVLAPSVGVGASRGPQLMLAPSVGVGASARDRG